MTADTRDSVIWRTVNPLSRNDAPLYLHVSGSVTWNRDSVSLAPHSDVSYGTYFGAFPGGHWRAFTDVSAVELVFESDAPVEVSIFRTDGEGNVDLIAVRKSSAGTTAIPVELPSTAGGWVWPEVRSGTNPVTVGNIVWRSSQPAVSAGHVAVAITTFDREADCVALLQSISTPSLREVVTRVVVADQGSRSLQAAPGFAEVSDALAARLLVMRQPNLGGSGGFSRGMLHAAAGDDDYVILLDDDVRLEPESIVRLAAFASRCRRRSIVGAHMLSMVEPTRLHSFGERVDRRTMWWSAVDPALSETDLSPGIRGIPGLSRRVDVDFNGWWMCLVPTSLVRESGASLPFFIKWDDAEFGLRAAARGVPTVTLPGTALWHMPWTAKDDGLDWQAYFQLRNRVVTGLLHGGRGVLWASFAQDVNHLLCAQYGSSAVRNTALRDILLGPAHLDPVLSAGPRRAAAIISRMGQSVIAPEALPESAPYRSGPPVGRVTALARLGRVMAHQLRRSSDQVPLPRLVRTEAKWWSLGVLDGAVVEAASGTGAFVLHRDRAVAWRELRRALLLRLQLWWQWNRISRAYIDDARSSASRQAWDERFTRADSSR